MLAPQRAAAAGLGGSCCGRGPQPLAQLRQAGGAGGGPDLRVKRRVVASVSALCASACARCASITASAAVSRASICSAYAPAGGVPSSVAAAAAGDAMLFVSPLSQRVSLSLLRKERAPRVLPLAWLVLPGLWEAARARPEDGRRVRAGVA